MLLFSKTYDYTTFLMTNYFLSQHLYQIQIKKSIELQPELYFTVKRTKNRVFSNLATSLSILFLLFGFLPQFQTNQKILTNNYRCTWKNKKHFYNLDLFLFLLLPKIKKSKELLRITNSNNFTEIHLFNLLNLYVLKTLDNDSALLAGFTLTNRLSYDTKTTSDLHFFRKNLVI